MSKHTNLNVSVLEMGLLYNGQNRLDETNIFSPVRDTANDVMHNPRNIQKSVQAQVSRKISLFYQYILIFYVIKVNSSARYTQPCPSCPIRAIPASIPDVY